MPTAPTAIKPKSGYEKWQDTIRSAGKNPAWDQYDCHIQKTVNEYNAHLSGKAAFQPLDWLIIKAIAWTETGATNQHWVDRPMQIGNTGDPGLAALLSKNEGGDLIMPPTIAKDLTVNLAATNPEANFQAGIGYLLMRLAKFGYETVYDPSNKEYKVRVKRNDSLFKIAKENGTTVKVLESMNPGIGLLRLDMELRYRKAAVEKAIQGWLPVNTTNIAQKYNIGDPEYSRKLDFVLPILKNRPFIVCP